MLESHLPFPAGQWAGQLLWGAEVPNNNVHEERQTLQSLLASDYGQFKTIIFGDPLATLPDQSFDELIEEHLRRKYGEHYSADAAD